MTIKVVFYSTAGYHSGHDGDTYVETGANAYPYPSGLGYDVGFVSLSSLLFRNNSTSVDHRLGGDVRTPSWTVTTYRIALPSTGDYDIALALGTMSASPSAVHAKMYDSTTQFGSTIGRHNGVSGGNFYDATGVQRTSAADWVSNNALVTRTFASTTFNLEFQGGSDYKLAAHIGVYPVGGSDILIDGSPAALTLTGIQGAVNLGATINGVPAALTLTGQTGQVDLVPNQAVVESITETVFSSDSTSHAVAMPATLNAGDGIIVFLTTDGDATVTTPAGWRRLYNESNGTALRGTAYARVSRGTEGGTTVDFVTSVAETAAAQVYRITNWSGSLTGIQAAPAGEITSGTTADPPSLTAYWGSAKNLWLASVHTSTSQTVSSAPTNYTDLTQTTSGSGTTHAQCITARRAVETATEDPGVFTMSGSGASKVYSTVSIAPVGFAPQYEHFEITRGTTLWVGMYVSQPHTVADAAITRAVIVCHGSGLDAAEYANVVNSAMSANLGEAIVLTPFFSEGDDPEADQIFWGSSWARLGLSDASLAWRISSGEVLDELITHLHATFVNLEGVVIAGHSAGGQLVNRYSACSTATDNRYLVSAPSSYMYPGAERTDGVGGWFTPTTPTTYDDYKYGTQNLSSISYVNSIGAVALRSRLQTAKVHYLCGALDNDPADTSMDLSAEAALQGAHRVERQSLFLDYLPYYYGVSLPNHVLVTPIAGVGHEINGVLASAEAISVYMQSFAGSLDILIDGIPATLTLTGIQGAVNLGATINGAPASLTLAGQSGQVDVGSGISGVPASLAITGLTGQVDQGIGIDGVIAALSLAGVQGQVSLGQDVLIDGLPASITLTGQSGQVDQGVTINGLPAALVLSGAAAQVDLGSTISGNPASLTITGLQGDVTLGTDIIIDGNPAALTLNGVAGLVGIGMAIDGVPAALTLTGATGDVVITNDIIINATPAALTLSGMTGTVTQQTTINGIPATLTLSGQVGQVSQGISINGIPADLQLTGINGDVLQNMIISGTPASLTLTGITGSISAGDVVSVLYAEAITISLYEKPITIN